MGIRRTLDVDYECKVPLSPKLSIFNQGTSSIAGVCWRECEKVSAKWGQADTSLLCLSDRIGSR